MNTREAAAYCNVTPSILLYVARRDGIGRKEARRWVFEHDELDRVFGGSAPFVAGMWRELQLLRALARAVQNRRTTVNIFNDAIHPTERAVFAALEEWERAREG